MLATVNGTPVHGSTSGTATTKALTVVVPADTRLLVLVAGYAGTVSSPFSFTSVALGSTVGTRIGGAQLWSWKFEAWVFDAPSITETTVTVTAPSAVKIGATAIFLDNARSLLSSANVAFLGSSTGSQGATTTAVYVEHPTTPTNNPTFLELSLLASIVNNQTFAVVSPVTSIFEDDSIATTNVHLALGSNTIAAYIGSTFGVPTDPWTLGTAEEWAGCSVVISGGSPPSAANEVQVDPKGYVCPSAATAPNVTPSGTSWNNSAWVQLTAASDTDWLVTGLTVELVNNGSPASGVDFEVDIGVGGAGSEAVITTFKGYVGDNNISYMWFPSFIPVDAIPSGSRVAVRMRKSGTSTNVWVFALSHLKKSTTSGVYVFASTKPTKVVPSAAVGTTLTNSGVAWSSGAWVQLIASTSTAIVLEAVPTDNFTQNGSVEVEIDIGIGAAASEVVITTLRQSYKGVDPSRGYILIPIWPPLDAIPASTRVAARMRSNDTVGTLPIFLLYKEKPL